MLLQHRAVRLARGGVMAVAKRCRTRDADAALMADPNYTTTAAPPPPAAAAAAIVRHQSPW